jgi:glycosyltransferase involved in cell wall biosynthesis
MRRMQEPPLTVCIGILARNEEAGIANVINDLSEQTLLSDCRISVQVHLIANACTDQTVEIAREAFASASFTGLGVCSSVHEIAEPGKANAWNTFVHQIAPPSTDFVLLLDGDIRIPEPKSLELMVERLAASPGAVVAVDRSVKDIELEQPRGMVERLIRLATGTASDPRTAIAGACYCARYSEVRKIWMPIGLPGEDGFLRAMLLTSSFEREERTDRLLFVENAYHVFESMRDLMSVVRHNVRLAIGTAINILLFWHFMKLRKEGSVDLGEYVRDRNNRDPNWVNDLIIERLRSSFFPLEPRFLLRRWRAVHDHPARYRSLKVWTVALLGTLFDLVVFFRATLLMRKGSGIGYW